MAAWLEALPKCLAENLSKGVKVQVGERSSYRFILAIEYGTNIPEIATEVQENVKSNRKYDWLTVVEVNVHVQGVIFSNMETHSEEDSRVK